MQSNTPDYRPYLTEGDLITSEDVLLWLSARAHSTDQDGKSGPEALAEAEEYLRARLDVERRAVESFGDCMENMRQRRWGYLLTQALAFRAAARKP